MHELLERQLRRHFESLDQVPEALKEFLETVDEAYLAADADRALMERSLELTSQELVQRNEELERELERLATTQAALAESEAQHRNIVETASEGMWLVDADGRTTFVNPALANMLGTDAESVMGKTIQEFLHKDAQPSMRKSLSSAAGKAKGTEIVLRRADGEPVWLHATSSPIQGEGESGGRLWMLADITARHAAEEQLVEAYERLEALVNFRTQFINNTAHELATPLTPIVLQVHMLKGMVADALDGRAKESLGILERNIARLQRLVGDVLDASRLQSGRLRLRREAMDMARVLKDGVASFAPVAAEKGVRLVSSIEGPLQVMGDPARLGQVIFNLLSNAIKFTPKGGTVRVSGQIVSGTVEATVEDTGSGIAVEKQEMLFQPFGQLHDTTQATETGTGLGLYVSRGIVEGLDGWIEAHSEGVGKGARFVVHIPQHNGSPAAAEAAEADRTATHA